MRKLELLPRILRLATALFLKFNTIQNFVYLSYILWMLLLSCMTTKLSSFLVPMVILLSPFKLVSNSSWMLTIIYQFGEFDLYHCRSLSQLNYTGDENLMNVLGHFIPGFHFSVYFREGVGHVCLNLNFLKVYT